MTQFRLERFFFYSFLIHISILGSILLSSAVQENKKMYYSVDFVGGPSSSGGAAAPEIQESSKEEPVKTKAVNPKEDLLVKSNKKDKKVKEVISAIPIPSIPIPKPRGKRGEEPSDVPSAIPSDSDGSGVGVGFGPDGYRGGSSAGNFPYQWYVHTVKTKLDSNWNVREGFSKRIYTQVAFTIRRDGMLTAIDIEESSGNEVFDRAAKRAVEMSSPCPPLPADFKESSLRVHVRFTVKR